MCVLLLLGGCVWDAGCGVCVHVSFLFLHQREIMSSGR